MLEFDTNAIGEVADTDFALSVALVVAGTVLADVLTGFAREHVVDLQMAGADAVYAVVAAVLAVAVLPNKYGKPLALGAAAGGTAIAAEEFGFFQKLGIEAANPA